VYSALKLFNYDDIAHHISLIIKHIVDTVIYSRDNTEDKLTADLTHQVFSSLWLVGAYYKMCKNPMAYSSNVCLTFELYEQYKQMAALNAQVLETEAAYVKL